MPLSFSIGQRVVYIGDEEGPAGTILNSFSDRKVTYYTVRWDGPLEEEDAFHAGQLLPVER